MYNDTPQTKKSEMKEANSELGILQNRLNEHGNRIGELMLRLRRKNNKILGEGCSLIDKSSGGEPARTPIPDPSTISQLNRIASQIEAIGNELAQEIERTENI